MVSLSIVVKYGCFRLKHDLIWLDRLYRTTSSGEYLFVKKSRICVKTDIRFGISIENWVVSCMFQLFLGIFIFYQKICLYSSLRDYQKMTCLENAIFFTKSRAFTCKIILEVKWHKTGLQKPFLIVPEGGVQANFLIKNENSQKSFFLRKDTHYWSKKRQKS